MSCASCIDNSQFYFTISYRKEGLVFNDQSVWRTAGDSELDTHYTIAFNINGQSKEHVVGINTSTLIRYEDFLIPECMDGVYTITTTICDQPFERVEAIMPNTECRINSLILNRKWDDAQQAIQHMEYLKADARLGLEKRAKERYYMLEVFLNKLNCKCDGAIN